ncbi:EXOSC9, partial [Cervus elaphus hippelaphus]
MFYLQRLDGRQTYDYRNIKISFGTDYGCCIVELGKTSVLGQVSCELVSPKLNRATEGILFFNLELSQMAAPAFEPGRQSDLLVKLNRLLQRCLGNSKCIDTESLCVVAGEKVWQIRVDLHLLNHDGNIIDAASIAAIVALCHFRRPDVSVQGDEVTLMAAPAFEPGRQSDLLVKLNRLLERCLRNSKCIDTESLCVVAGEKNLSVSKPVLWTPGTAQIGEGIENSWGHLEDSEKEDEDEGGSDEAVILDGVKMDPGVEVSNIGSQDAPIVLSDSEEEEMIILEPDKNPKKI